MEKTLYYVIVDNLAEVEDGGHIIIDGKVESMPILMRFKAGLNKMNFRLVTQSGMFHDCKALKKIISIFDINRNTNINDISELFGGCTSLRELPDSISTWDTSKIENMEGIFYECQSLNYLPDISKWDTSKVNNMMSIFNRCTTLRSLANRISVKNKIKEETSFNLICGNMVL